MPKNMKGRGGQNVPSVGDTGVNRGMGSPSRSPGGLGKNPGPAKSVKMSDVGNGHKKPGTVADVGVKRGKASVKDVMASRSTPRKMNDV